MNPRGQTLALFSVTMLGLVVMVGITLTIGMRVREKVELQTLADASAYSNAVVTARAHNQIAVWNRAQVAHMMTLAGVQSQISYSSWYVSMLKASEYGGYATASLASAICAAAAFGCGPCAQCCPTIKVAIKFAKAFGKEFKSQKQNFKNIHENMARSARVIQGTASLYGAAGQTLFLTHVASKAQGGLAGKVLELGTARAINPGEYGQTSAAKLVSANEFRKAVVKATQDSSLPATNGSRKDEFLRSRGGAIPPYPPVLAMQNSSITGFFPSGTGHFGRGKHQPVDSGDNQAWGEDEGFAAGLINITSMCPLPTGGWATASVKSSAQQFTSEHKSSPGLGGNGNEDTLHDLGQCTDERGRPCNSVWISHQDFNINPADAQKERPGSNGQAAEAGPREQWRQPVTMVGLKRDYSARTKRDPWEFNFSMSVTKGSSTQIDLKKNQVGGSSDEQRVLATAITYYHRHMQNAGQSWTEPPNFFNPYWRATLVPADIDGNTNMTLAGGVLAGALKAAGFKGVQ